MTQTRLFPDARPLVERLGLDFFRQAPAGPGVYLMRDATGIVLYVGKAKNLRKRLGSYRVANPDRLLRRQLRLLRAVARIDVEKLPDEAAALAREADLLRTLKPRFNRAGTWPGLPRFLAWRVSEAGLEFAVLAAAESGWVCHGPLGAGANYLRAALVRLLWCALHPERGVTGMPLGWFQGRYWDTTTIPRYQAPWADFQLAEARLVTLSGGQTQEFVEWIRERTSTQQHPFEQSAREADLEFVSNAFAPKSSDRSDGPEQSDRPDATD